MKLWYAVFAGLLGLAATSGVAEAQWSGDVAPVWRDDRYDDPYDDGYGDPYGDGYDDGYDRGAGRSRAALSRAAHTLSLEGASFADALHAIAPRSRIARDAMGFALAAEQLHRAVESGSPPDVLVRRLRALTREMSQLVGIAGVHPVSRRVPQLHQQLARMTNAFEIAREAARDELRVRRSHHGHYGSAPYVRAAPPAVAVPLPRVVRPRYEIRVGF